MRKYRLNVNSKPRKKNKNRTSKESHSSNNSENYNTQSRNKALDKISVENKNRDNKSDKSSLSSSYDYNIDGAFEVTSKNKPKLGNKKSPNFYKKYNEDNNESLVDVEGNFKLNKKINEMDNFFIKPSNNEYLDYVKNKAFNFNAKPNVKKGIPKLKDLEIFHNQKESSEAFNNKENKIKNEKIKLLNKYSQKLNFEWTPIFDKNGVVYFYNRLTRDTSINFPKIYNNKYNRYENLFFKDWIKVKDEQNKHVYWKNMKYGYIQYVKPSSTVYFLEAIFMENLAFVNFYLQYNGDANVTDKKGRNALHYLAMNDCVEILNLLLEYNINLDAQEMKEKQSPIFYALKYSSFRIFRILITRNANINIKDIYGNTLLHYSVKIKNKKIILFLLAKGARLDIKNSKNKFPIDVAVENNDWETVEFLVKLSGDTTKKSLKGNIIIDGSEFDNIQEDLDPSANFLNKRNIGNNNLIELKNQKNFDVFDLNHLKNLNSSKFLLPSESDSSKSHFEKNKNDNINSNYITNNPPNKIHFNNKANQKQTNHLSPNEELKKSKKINTKISAPLINQNNFEDIEKEEEVFYSLSEEEIVIKYNADNLLNDMENNKIENKIKNIFSTKSIEKLRNENLKEPKYILDYNFHNKENFNKSINLREEKVGLMEPRTIKNHVLNNNGNNNKYYSPLILDNNVKSIKNQINLNDNRFSYVTNNTDKEYNYYKEYSDLISDKLKVLGENSVYYFFTFKTLFCKSIRLGKNKIYEMKNKLNHYLDKFWFYYNFNPDLENQINYKEKVNPPIDGISETIDEAPYNENNKYFNQYKYKLKKNNQNENENDKYSQNNLFIRENKPVEFHSCNAIKNSPPEPSKLFINPNNKRANKVNFRDIKSFLFNRVSILSFINISLDKSFSKENLFNDSNCKINEDYCILALLNKYKLIENISLEFKIFFNRLYLLKHKLKALNNSKADNKTFYDLANENSICYANKMMLNIIYLIFNIGKNLKRDSSSFTRIHSKSMFKSSFNYLLKLLPIKSLDMKNEFINECENKYLLIKRNHNFFMKSIFQSGESIGFNFGNTFSRHNKKKDFIFEQYFSELSKNQAKVRDEIKGTDENIFDNNITDNNRNIFNTSCCIRENSMILKNLYSKGFSDLLVKLFENYFPFQKNKYLSKLDYEYKNFNLSLLKNYNKRKRKKFKKIITYSFDNQDISLIFKRKKYGLIKNKNYILSQAFKYHENYEEIISSIKSLNTTNHEFNFNSLEKIMKNSNLLNFSQDYFVKRYFKNLINYKRLKLNVIRAVVKDEINLKEYEIITNNKWINPEIREKIKLLLKNSLDIKTRNNDSYPERNDAHDRNFKSADFLKTHEEEFYTTKNIVNMNNVGEGSNERIDAIGKNLSFMNPEENIFDKTNNQQICREKNHEQNFENPKSLFNLNYLTDFITSEIRENNRYSLNINKNKYSESINRYLLDKNLNSNKNQNTDYLYENANLSYIDNNNLPNICDNQYNNDNYQRPNFNKTREIKIEEKLKQNREINLKTLEFLSKKPNIQKKIFSTRNNKNKNSIFEENHNMKHSKNIFENDYKQNTSDAIQENIKRILNINDVYSKEIDNADQPQSIGKQNQIKSCEIGENFSDNKKTNLENHSETDYLDYSNSYSVNLNNQTFIKNQNNKNSTSAKIFIPKINLDFTINIDKQNDNTVSKLFKNRSIEKKNSLKDLNEDDVSYQEDVDLDEIEKLYAKYNNDLLTMVKTSKNETN